MTYTIYFLKAEDYNSVVFISSDGRWFYAPEDNGYNLDTGVDLYAENAAEMLAKGYEDTEFNSFDDNHENAYISGDKWEEENIKENICKMIAIRTITE